MQRRTIKINEVQYETVPAPVKPWSEGAPNINGPDIYGASPRCEFLFLTPVVGERPLKFSAKNLPKGLSVNADSGHIKGCAEEKGEFNVILFARNRYGEASKSLKLIIKEGALALTPPMGWNSWNCFRSDITQENILKLAESMVNSGLAARGYSYINMDSGWQSTKRGGVHNSIIPHEGFFDMKELCEKIHSLGLKAGIYSAPYVVPWGTNGCGTTSGDYDTSFSLCSCHDYKSKYIGIIKHEREDAAQWADWGFDYLKYDWAATDMLMTERMSKELRNLNRDILFSITTSVDIKEAMTVKRLTNLWRSNHDTRPDWASVLNNGFGNQQWNPFIGPGHWFDLDMTAIMERNGRKLTANELITCISCWMMRPGPIMIDCYLPEIDDFTLRLLCNEEIIAINQDLLGKPAASIYNSPEWEIQVKPLSGGGYALAFFNLGEDPAIAPLNNLDTLGIERPFSVRDLWARKDLGVFDKDFIVGVNAHCAKVFKISLLS